MLRDTGNLYRALAWITRPRKAVITPTPRGPPVEVAVGDEVQIVYEGEVRRIRVLAITAWGLRAWDEVKAGIRGFRFDKIGAAGQPPETDTAASG